VYHVQRTGAYASALRQLYLWDASYFGLFVEILPGAEDGSTPGSTAGRTGACFRTYSGARPKV
jgi:hypothetical protein